MIEKLGFKRYGEEPYTGPDFGEPTYWILFKQDRPSYAAKHRS